MGALRLLLPGLAAMGIGFTNGIARAEGPPAAAPTALAPADPKARPPKIPAADFASQNLFNGAKLSPNGKLFALRAAVGNDFFLMLFDAETRKIARTINLGGKDQVEWFRWAGDDKILLSMSKAEKINGEEIRYTRLLLYDLPSQQFHFIGKASEGPEGDDVLYVDPAGAYILLSIQRTVFDWPSVWRFPLGPDAEKKAVRVQREQPGVWEWYADDAGVVRMGTEFTNRSLKIWYRGTASDDIKVISRLTEADFEQKWPDVARIVGGSDEGYVIERDGKTMVLRKYNYATRTSGDVVYRNPEWDVTEVDIGDDGKPLAAYYTDDKNRVEWFDPRMKSIQARLERALPGSDIWILSRARDDSRMLVYSSRENDPGALYVYTAADRSLAFFADYRPALAIGQLAEPKPIRYTARDKTAIRGYLTLPRGREAKGLPLIIMPHGGPYGIRDRLQYDDEVQFLANRGYAVLQPNYRGSSGFGEDFEKLGRGQIGRMMQDDIDDAMDWAVKEGIADPGRVCVVGASYGGYAAVWSVIRNPERYRCAASFAGVTDWKKQLGYNANFLSGKNRKAWRSRVVGDDASFDLDLVSPYRQVARLNRPVLLAHGDKDTTVPFSQFKIMRDASIAAKAPVEQLVFAGEGHGFAKKENEQRWYEYLDSFLARNNPAD